MIRQPLALIAVVLVGLHVTPTAAACTLFPEAFGTIAWTDEALLWSDDFEVRRLDPSGDVVTLARAFPSSRFQASPAGDLILFQQGVGNRNTAMCDYGPYELWTWTPDDGAAPGAWQPANEGRVLAVDWAGGRVAVATGGINVTIHELTTGAEITRLYVGASSRYLDVTDRVWPVGGGAWSSDGEKLALFTEERVFLFDARDWSYLYDDYPSFPTLRGHVRVSFIPDGSALAVASSHGSRFSEIRVLDLSDPNQLEFAAGRLDVRAIRALAYAPGESGRLAVVYEYPEIYSGAPPSRPAITVLDADLNVLHEHEWPRGNAHEGLTWSPDGERVAFAVNRDLYVAPWDLSELTSPVSSDAPGRGLRDVSTNANEGRGASPTPEERPRALVPAPGWALVVIGVAAVAGLGRHRSR